MEAIKRALNDLYKAVDDPDNASEYIEQAIEQLCEGINEIGSSVASIELTDVVETLQARDVDNAIYELEVMENEL
ncbi:MAG: hypothetical protein GY787_21435 [Alteromonadales bacterium]|nr:hypothetical protein [Alteromonadales bacterium]